MASYLRPRRGKKSTALSQNIVLKRGEVFFEVPEPGGVGSGKGRIIMGDGTSTYDVLKDKAFLESFNINADDTLVAFTNRSADDPDADPYAKTANYTYLENFDPGNSVKTLFTNLKKLLVNYNSQLDKLNNDLLTKADKIQLSNGSVTKVGTSTVGSSSKGIYLNNGVPTACSYSVNKDVPSNAVFTDTNNKASVSSVAKSLDYTIASSGNQQYTLKLLHSAGWECIGFTKMATGANVVFCYFYEVIKGNTEDTLNMWLKNMSTNAQTKTIAVTATYILKA